MKETRILALIFAVSLLIMACSQTQTFSSATETATPPASAAPAETAAAEPEETPVAELEDASTTYPVTVTDLAGYASVVTSADRIISLAPSNTEILISAGAADRVVGVDESSSALLPEVEIVGDYMGPDAERIVALEPDVILAGNTLQQETIDQLRSMGLTVIVSEATYWDQVAESFELVGQVINENDAGAQLALQLEGTITDVEALAPAEKLTCYYVMSFGEGGNWTSGEGSFINAMITYAGGVPVTQGSPSTWLDYPLEDLIAADPDCLIISSEAGDYEDLQQEPGYADLTAVRTGQVFQINADIVTRPGPRLNEGLLAMSGILNAAAAGPVATQEATGAAAMAENE